MKVDKETLPIYISVALSLITFFAIWMFGGTALVFLYSVLLPIIFLLWIFFFILLMARKDLRKIISPTAITNAFIIYLGVLFISLSRFKTEISKVNIDMNMIAVGLALIAIALGFTTQYREHKEQRLETENSAKDSTPEIPNEGESSTTNQALPSIDVVLDETRRSLDFQFDQLNGIVTKSGIVLGVGGIIFTLLVTHILDQSTISPNLFLFTTTLILIFVSLILSFVPIYIIKWNRPPNLNRLRDYYIVKDVGTTKLNVIDKCLEAVDSNKKLIDKLFRLIKGSYIVLLIGLILLAVWLGISVW